MIDYAIIIQLFGRKKKAILDGVEKIPRFFLTEKLKTIRKSENFSTPFKSNIFFHQNKLYDDGIVCHNNFP